MGLPPIVEVIIRIPGTTVQDVVFQCPDLVWHEIFLTIDRVRQGGILAPAPKGQGRYLVQVSDQAATSTHALAAAYGPTVCEKSSTLHERSVMVCTQASWQGAKHTSTISTSTRTQTN